MLKTLSVLAAVALCLAGSTAARGQDLGDLILRLIDQEFRLGSSRIAGSQHTFHFDEAETIAESLNDALVQQLTSATPLSTASGGVALEWDPEVNSFTRKTSSFGPIFAERAETLGAGRFNLGFSYLRLDYDTIDGIALGDGALGFDVKHEETGEGDGTTLDNFVEGDLVRLDLALEISTETLALFGSFGVSDRFDVSVALPVVSVEIEVGLEAQVKPLSTGGFDDPEGRLVHEFPDGGQKLSPDPLHGEESGIGDLVVRGKYNLTPKAEGKGLAVAAELSFPTGDDDNLLGTGATGLKLLAVGSATFGRFSPHLNLGYGGFSGGKTALPDQVHLAVGFDLALGEKVTLAADLFGRTLLDSRRLQISQEDHLFRICDGCSGADPDESTMAIGSVRRDVLRTVKDDLSLFFASLGAKIRLPATRDLLLTTNLLYSVSSDGLRDEDLIALFGLDCSF